MKINHPSTKQRKIIKNNITVSISITLGHFFLGDNFFSVWKTKHKLRLDEGLEQDNSDSVNDSQTGDPSIKEALFNLNENMGKMAGLLENLYNRPCSEDCDRPPGSKRRRRSRSPDTRSADEDEPRGKRRCNSAEDVDNEDRLSVDAVSDIDSDIRLLTRESDAQPQVNDHGELDENLLMELDESLDQKEAIGPPVQKQLAEIANKRWGQNLTPERVKMLNERYSTPANCTNMTPIKVNPEIWKQLTSAKRKTDLQLSNLQETVATAILQTADELLPQNKDDVAKNLAARSIDSVAMLGHMSHMISQLRREQIRPALKQEYASICTADPTNTPLLFGDDLVKQLKEAKETSSITQNLANDAMKKNSVRGGGETNTLLAAHFNQQVPTLAIHLIIAAIIIIIKHNHNQSQGIFLEGPEAERTEKEMTSGSINDIRQKYIIRH